MGKVENLSEFVERRKIAQEETRAKELPLRVYLFEGTDGLFRTQIYAGDRTRLKKILTACRVLECQVLDLMEE